LYSLTLSSSSSKLREMDLSALMPSPVTDDISSNWGTEITQANSSSDTLSEPSSNINLREHAKNYRIAPNIGKRNRGWVWKYGIRLEMLSDKSIWWLCRRC